MISPNLVTAPTAAPPADPPVPTAFLVFDTESVPDGKLLQLAKYADDPCEPEQAVERARQEAIQNSHTGSDFIPVTFHVPVAACVLRVGADYRIQHVACLDAPHYRPRRIVEQFWAGVNKYRKQRDGGKDGVKLVTFNGRCFDLPLLELAAFRYGVAGADRQANGRRRYDGWHLDLMDWFTNHGAYRLVGGLNVLSKLLGKPGKMDVKGDQVYQLHRGGKTREINDYCLCDTLDTYFVFLRSRVVAGELSLEDEHRAVLHARDWLQQQLDKFPALQAYLDHWGDWNPWP
jgi:predicted PolB exonuclease-like 3'-5' exonuclease